MTIRVLSILLKIGRQKYMLHKENGFTIIELLIVMAIIGVLAAIAINQYQSYIARSQVTRVVAESGNSRTIVENCINNGKFVIGKESDGLCDTKATPSSIIVGESQGDRGNIAGMGVAQATINADGTATIIAEFGNSATPSVLGEFIRWDRSAGGGWSCESTADDKYNDPSCL